MNIDRSAGHRGRFAPWAGPVSITALGAATCFGGAVTAAAGARAGLSRARALPDMKYVDDETFEETPVTGAPIVGMTDGFEGAGRLGRMSQCAVEELANAATWMDTRRMTCFLALPVLAEDASRRVAAAVARAIGAHVDQVHTHRSGHSGAASALRDAAEALRTRRCDHAVVGACDSWLDPARLQTIVEAGRLKTRNDPVGFTPGEAAVFLLMERPNTSAGEHLATLVDVREEAEDNSFASEKPATGIGLARAALAVLGTGARGTIYVDLNGEPFRAADWGMALTRMHASVEGWVSEMPAASFGDIGIAAPFLSAMLATRAFVRGHAVGDRALILASGDGSERLALMVERPRRDAMQAERR